VTFHHHGKSRNQSAGCWGAAFLLRPQFQALPAGRSPERVRGRVHQPIKRRSAAGASGASPLTTSLPSAGTPDAALLAGGLGISPAIAPSVPSNPYALGSSFQLPVSTAASPSHLQISTVGSPSPQCLSPLSATPV
jgi:hypothetical protein